MELALTQLSIQRRELARQALQQPAVGAALLEITQWLEGLTRLMAPGDGAPEPKVSLRCWARRRIARIIAKRMRYSIEALQPLLPGKLSQRWHEQAASLQLSIGATRDVVQAIALVAKLEIEPGIMEFLRGVAAGREK
jgi:hypothetical protein